MEARYRCPQCKERFKDSGDRIPKLLPACLHSVCLACLSAIYAKDQTLRCPIASCGLENSTKLPEEGMTWSHGDEMKWKSRSTCCCCCLLMLSAHQVSRVSRATSWCWMDCPHLKPSRICRRSFIATTATNPRSLSPTATTAIRFVQLFNRSWWLRWRRRYRWRWRNKEMERDEDEEDRSVNGLTVLLWCRVVLVWVPRYRSSQEEKDEGSLAKRPRRTPR